MVKHSNEAVSSLCFNSNGLELITGSHDGSLKVWDIRKVSSVSLLCTHIQAHQLKHDEGVLAVVVHPT